MEEFTTVKKRNPRRRANKKNPINTVNLKILQTNIYGYISKKESLCEIANAESFDIITVNDTALKGSMKVKIPKYFCYSKNRERNKGGVATVVANYLKQNASKVAEGREGDEYIITRIDITIPAINVVNIYGSQEGRVDKDEVEKSWLRLLEDVKDIEDRDEDVIIIGDLNRAVGGGEWGVKGNKEKVLPGGQLVRNLIMTERYILINNLDIVKGGPWTWVDRQDSTRRSCLDLGIISASLVPFVGSVIVDVDRKFTPRRVIRRKKKVTTIYSDHFSLMVELKGMPRTQSLNQQESRWNMGKPGGWEAYEKLTDEKADKIEKIIEDSDINIENVIKEIDKRGGGPSVR